MAKNKFLSRLASIFVGLALLFCECNFAYASTIAFTADTKIDMSNIRFTLYALSGSTCNSITFSDDYTTVIVSIAAGDTFKIGSSSSNYLQISPEDGTVTLTLPRTYFNTEHYVTNWQLSSSDVTSVFMAVSVEEQYKMHSVYAEGEKIGAYDSGGGSMINFSYNLNGTKIFSFEANTGSTQNLVSNSSGGGVATNSSTTTYSVTSTPTTTATTETTTTTNDEDADIDTSDEAEVVVPAAVSLNNTLGEFAQTVKQVSAEDKAVAVEYPKSLKVTKADGSQFVGGIKAPEKVQVKTLTVKKETTNTADTAEKSEVSSLGAVRIETSDNSDLKFSDNFQVTIPYDEATLSNLDTVNVYYYNPETQSYEKVEGKKVVDEETKTISVETDKLGIYSVFELDVDAVDLEGNVKKTEQHTVASSGGGGGGGGARTASKQIFNDLNPRNRFAGYVEELVDQDVISGYEDGTFKPTESINRAELSKVAVKGFNLEIPAEVSTNFDDVSSLDWFTPYVASLSSKGMVSGYGDGSFKPGNSTSRAEAIKILVEASEVTLPEVTDSDLIFEDVTKDDWYAPYAVLAYKAGLIEGEKEITSSSVKNYFRPNSAITRAEVAKVVVLLQEMKENKVSWLQKISPKNLFTNLINIFK